jgi:hypothetical protein
VETFFTRLTRSGILTIYGEDAADFLQSQLTSDINLLQEGGSQISAWCNPKGRIIANFYIARRDNVYYVLMPAELVEPVHRRLSMYILRSRVRIENKSEDLVAHGLGGEKISPAADYLNQPEDCVPVKVPDNSLPRIIIMNPVNSTTVQKISSSNKSIGLPEWQLMDIDAGIPWITEQTSEMIIPQEMEMEKLDGLSLNKGCFPGQEVIARIHYRGTMKYGLYLGAEKPASIAPAAGAKLYTPDKGESCGTVINVGNDRDHKCHILAVLKHAYANLGNYIFNDIPLTITFKPAHP